MNRSDPEPHAPRPPSEVEGHGPETGEPAPGGNTAAPPPEPERRLSALTLVTAPLDYLKNYIVPILIAVVAGSFNLWILASAGVVVAAMLLGGIVTWCTFRYRVGSQRLEIRKGLLSRTRRSIPLERVRGVDVTSKLLHRALGLAVVRIEAAAGGEGDEEAKLDAVSVTEAERLRRVLLRRRAMLRGTDASVVGVGAEPGAPVDVPPADGSPAGPVVYFRTPATWYFYALLSPGYLLTPFAALAAVAGFVAQNLDELNVDLKPGSPAYEAAESLVRSGTMALVAIGAVAVAVLLVLMPVFAVVSYAVSYWGFTLRGTPESLVTERGLFTRRTVTLERRRIRGYELLDSPLERLRRAVRLRAIVTGLGDAATRAALLPTGGRDRVAGVVEQALHAYRGTLVAHPRAALGRRLFRAVAPFAVAAGAAEASGTHWLAASLGMVALLGVPLGVDRYRALGHGSDGHRVSVRSGSLRRRQAVVERPAVVGWTWRQTLFQRRSGLADLRLAVGAGAGGYTADDAALQESVAFAADVTPAMVRPFLEP